MATDILIKNPEHAVGEPKMLQAVIQHAVQWETANSIIVWASARVPNDAPEHKYPGWLEWGLSIQYGVNGQIYIGCIQRKPNAEIEFHS